MKKILSYFVCLLATIGVLWFGLLSITTPYAEPGRWQYIVGLGVSLLIAVIFAGLGNSLQWKKDKK